LQRLGQRLDAEKGQKAGGQRHERDEPLRPRATKRREPQQAERDRNDADEEADRRVARAARDGRGRRLDRRRNGLRRLDPGRARHADGDRVVLDPRERDGDGAGGEPRERRIAVDPERHDRVVDRDRGDRDLVPLRVRDADPDLAGVELDTADVEFVGSGRRPAEEVRQRPAPGGEGRHNRHEQQQRPERPDAPAAGSRRRFGPRDHSRTSK